MRRLFEAIRAAEDESNMLLAMTKSLIRAEAVGYSDDRENEALISTQVAGASQDEHTTVVEEKAQGTLAALEDRFKEASEHANRLKAEKEDRLTRAGSIRRFVEELGEGMKGDGYRQIGDRQIGQEGSSQRGEAGTKNEGSSRRGEASTIDVWDEQAWSLLVTQVTVRAEGTAEFLFRGENRIVVM